LLQLFTHEDTEKHEGHETVVLCTRTPPTDALNGARVYNVRAFYR
jgi:hypothetical protein